jgi:hypothetical protein
MRRIDVLHATATCISAIQNNKRARLLPPRNRMI